MKATEKQIEDVMNILQQVKHQRPLLVRLDSLEEERVLLEKQISGERPDLLLKVSTMSKQSVLKFLSNYKVEFKSADIERKKALLQSCIGDIVLSGDLVKINPS
ncbi:MAG: hypothetical protein AUK35_09230 [Zetaproteobacteria bacterium CG2_30_46_52]|nr:MAG: hypothetical protein AUK35_09230 [Zetaproteobacteria bacterium CG2_30_46_52]